MRGEERTWLGSSTHTMDGALCWDAGRVVWRVGETLVEKDQSGMFARNGR